MSNPESPLALAAQVEERYRDYLTTTFNFRDPDLRASFKEELAGGHLTAGPFLEATPVFEPADTTRELITGELGPVEEAFLDALHPDRRLYQHQSDAIRRVGSGRNLILATGTGSGKTEAFLLPILLSLYREHQEGTLGHGVRALILYPMNALANDQRERIGQIARALDEGRSAFRFTFGQYTGHTPEDERDQRRSARNRLDRRYPRESILRAEMRAAPPNILITNYSMLEYLLIRPQDNPLFASLGVRGWDLLVLDEVHLYRGAKAIEMAMLLRRLKQRLREAGKKGPFQCIGTSATLAGGNQDRLEVAEFADRLFGEPFQAEDVLLPRTVPLPSATQLNLSSEDYRFLAGILDGEHNLNEIPNTSINQYLASARQQSPAEDPARMIGFILSVDARATRLRGLLSREPIPVSDAAGRIFPELPPEVATTNLVSLIRLLSRAEDPRHGSTLLSVRYHFLLRALEGAYVSYHPTKRVYLDRSSASGEGAIFEVALCQECGQHYLLTCKDFMGGPLVPPVRDTASPDYGVTFLRPLSREEHDADKDETAVEKAGRSFMLCAVCGETWPVNGEPETHDCQHQETLIVVREDSPQEDDRLDRMVRCGACGYSGQDPVREVIHGTDGPHTVIATTLHQHLPPARRKILAFTDGRQEAAFFAWYLDRTYRDIVIRNRVYAIIRELSPNTVGGLAMSEIASELTRLFVDQRIMPSATGELELRRAAWTALYRECATEARRLSLEGVGLVQWGLRWPDWYELPRILFEPPWSLPEETAWALLLALLNTVRHRGVLELRADAGTSPQWAELGLYGRQGYLQLSSTGVSRRGGQPSAPVHAWMGPRTVQAEYLMKILIRKGLDPSQAATAALELLQALWDHFSNCDENAPRPEDRLFTLYREGKRLNPDWLRLKTVGPDRTLFGCDTCGTLDAASVEKVCPRYRCPGTLSKINPSTLKENHYRRLYEENLPPVLRTEEHTAQLDTETAWRYQLDFREGRIHALSSSTTFELGVDLGDLDTIFLRNVPPESFNYVQRVGRAGRRRGFPGLAVTYCRRSPHDLYYFQHPAGMIDGFTRPPIFRLENGKIVQRHMTAFVLSHFFRREENDGRFGDVERLLGGFDRSDLLPILKKFLEANKVMLVQELKEIVPEGLHRELGLENGMWTDGIAGSVSRLAEAVAAVAEDYRNLKALEDLSAADRYYEKAAWAKRRLRTIGSDDVLSFLSRKAVIPKYGFPVDVVGLDILSASNSSYGVELERDLRLAIAEFAPTGKIVANKREWESYALKRVPEREWERRHYKRCARHGAYVEWTEGEPERSLPCDDEMPVYTYVVPKFGFTTAQGDPPEPRGRTARVFTTRPYFIGHADRPSTPHGIPQGNPLLQLHKTSPGDMIILCEGRRGEGFYVCEKCGAGFRSNPIKRADTRLRGKRNDSRSGSHRTALGTECRGQLINVSLGHAFTTDVLTLMFLPTIPPGIETVWFSYGLAFALIAGAAEVLGVPRRTSILPSPTPCRGCLRPLVRRGLSSFTMTFLAARVWWPISKTLASCDPVSNKLTSEFVARAVAMSREAVTVA